MRRAGICSIASQSALILISQLSARLPPIRRSTANRFFRHRASFRTVFFCHNKGSCRRNNSDYFRIRKPLCQPVSLFALAIFSDIPMLSPFKTGYIFRKGKSYGEVPRIMLCTFYLPGFFPVRPFRSIQKIPSVDILPCLKTRDSIVRDVSRADHHFGRSASSLTGRRFTQLI